MSFETKATKAQGGVLKHHGKPTDPLVPLKGIFAGQSGAGKTWQLSKWLCDLAKRKGKACLFDKIIWVAPEYSLKQKGALQVVRRCWSGHFDALEPTQTAELDALMKKHDEAGFQFLVVMDDCMAIIQKSRPLSSFYDQLFCAVRHLHGSVISLEQRIFCGNRTRRLQSSLYCVWKMMGKSEFAAFARQVAGSKKDAELLTRAYSNILRKDPHGFITIDLRRRKPSCQGRLDKRNSSAESHLSLKVFVITEVVYLIELSTDFLFNDLAYWCPYDMKSCCPMRLLFLCLPFHFAEQFPEYLHGKE